MSKALSLDLRLRVPQHRFVGQHRQPHQRLRVLPSVARGRQRPERRTDQPLGPRAALGFAEQAQAHLPEAVPKQTRLQALSPVLQNPAAGRAEPAADNPTLRLAADLPDEAFGESAFVRNALVAFEVIGNEFLPRCCGSCASWP